VEDPFDIVESIPHVYEVKSQNASFDLWKRATHVFSEAKRVHQFKSICESMMPEDQKVEKLGKLMNESQLSCKMYYDCSSEQLDEVT
jgi:N-acetylgalactosamine kinase